MWQYLLTDGTRDGLGAIRTVLGEFLDGFAVAAGDAKEYFEALIANWLSDCETSALFDWRYYLLLNDVPCDDALVR